MILFSIVGAALQIVVIDYKDTKMNELRERAIKNHSSMESEFVKEYPNYVKVMNFIAKYH
jgi:hypothetical protein